MTIVGPGTIVAQESGPAVKIAGSAAAPRVGVALRNLQLVGKSPYTGLGGAVLVEHGDRVSLEDCTVRDSVAGRGGGLALVDSVAVELRRCEIRGNRGRARWRRSTSSRSAA